VAPDDPDARYAGVLLWRALVDERALPDGVARPRSGEPSREVYAGPCRFQPNGAGVAATPIPALSLIERMSVERAPVTAFAPAARPPAPSAPSGL